MSGRILKGEKLETGGSLLEEVSKVFSSNPHKIFIEEVKRKKTITYGEMWDVSRNVAASLQDMGVSEGDIVTVCAESNVIETYAFIVGVWLSGATVSPIDPSFTENKMYAVLQATQTAVVYCDEQYVPKISAVIDKLGREVCIISPNGKYPIINCYDYMKKDKNLNKYQIYTKNSKDHVLYILFTSGTSGEPKGSTRTSESQNHVANSFSWPEQRKMLIASQVFWGTNVAFFLKTILSRGSLVLSLSYSPEDLLHTITEYKPELMFVGPSTLMKMCLTSRLEQFDTTSLKKVYIGGSHMLVQNKKEATKILFNNRNIIFNIFGCTEAGIIIFLDEVDENSAQFGSMGKVAKGVEVKVIDVNSGEILGPFQNGEMCVKSDCILKKYIQRPLTEDELDADGWWHTGDLVYYDDKDYIYYVARMKELIKCRGHQIAPAEIETILQSHPDVIECCVVGKPHKIDVEHPTAFVVKDPQSGLTERDLYDLVSEKAEDEKKLRGGVYFVDSIPKSSVGKVLRHELLNLIKS